MDTKKVLVLAGILISLSWSITAGISERNSNLKGAKAFSDLAYSNCAEAKSLAHDTNVSDCEAERQKNVEKWLADGKSNYNVAIAALIPIPLVWISGFILVYLTRIQIAGFRAVVGWSALSSFKKVVTSLCALILLFGILGAVTFVLNLYTDTQVPVSLSPFVDVNQTGETIYVSGTWTRTDLLSDTIAYPLQTSKLQCFRDSMTCSEAKAYVSNNLLETDLERYDVKSWTADAVTFEDEEMCATTLYTIDLRTKTVSGAGHSNQETTYCKMGDANSKKNWSLLLTNGFNVYWQQRKNARPLVLKIVQSFFGN